MTAEEHNTLNRKIDELLVRTQALDSKLANLERRVDATIEMQGIQFEAMQMPDFLSHTYTDDEIKQAGGVLQAYNTRKNIEWRLKLQEYQKQRAGGLQSFFARCLGLNKSAAQ